MKYLYTVIGNLLFPKRTEKIEIKSENSLKFLGVMINESLT